MFHYIFKTALEKKLEPKKSLKWGSKFLKKNFCKTILPVLTAVL